MAPPDERKRFSRNIVKKPGKRPTLSPFALRFVSEFQKDLNGAAAYRRAGGRRTNPSQAAYELRRKPEVAALLAKAEAKNLAENAATAVRMVEENRRQCLTNVKRFVDEQGNLLPITDWTEEMGAQVASIEVVKRNITSGDGVLDEVIKVKFWNKNQALELMHKHLRLLEAVDPNEGLPDVPAFLLPPGSKVKIT